MSTMTLRSKKASNATPESNKSSVPSVKLEFDSCMEHDSDMEDVGPSDGPAPSEDPKLGRKRGKNAEDLEDAAKKLAEAHTRLSESEGRTQAETLRAYNWEMQYGQAQQAIQDKNDEKEHLLLQIKNLQEENLRLSRKPSHNRTIEAEKNKFAITELYNRVKILNEILEEHIKSIKQLEFENRTLMDMNASMSLELRERGAREEPIELTHEQRTSMILTVKAMIEDSLAKGDHGEKFASEFESLGLI